MTTISLDSRSVFATVRWELACRALVLSKRPNSNVHYLPLLVKALPVHRSAIKPVQFLKETTHRFVSVQVATGNGKSLSLSVKISSSNFVFYRQYSTAARRRSSKWSPPVFSPCCPAAARECAHQSPDRWQYQIPRKTNHASRIRERRPRKGPWGLANWGKLMMCESWRNGTDRHWRYFVKTIMIWMSE